MRAKLESVWRQTGVRPKELDELVELPDVFKYLWQDFLMLNSARTSNGFGVNPLQYSEMLAYFTLQGIQVQPWEVEVLRVLDNAVLQVYADKQKQESKKTKK